MGVLGSWCADHRRHRQCYFDRYPLLYHSLARSFSEDAADEGYESAGFGLPATECAEPFAEDGLLLGWKFFQGGRELIDAGGAAVEVREDGRLKDAVEEASERHFRFVEGAAGALGGWNGLDGTHFEEEVQAHGGRTTGDFQFVNDVFETDGVGTGKNESENRPDGARKGKGRGDRDAELHYLSFEGVHQLN